MKTLLPKLQEEILSGSSRLCNQSLADIVAWKVDPALDESKQKFLVPQGMVELHGIGMRFKKRFPNLFDHEYDTSKFKFKYTKTQRAEASARSFVGALFGEQGKEVHFPAALDADPILRFYKNCPKWKKEVDKNPETYIEQIRFVDSEHIRLALKSIKERLGFVRDLTFEEIKLMYTTCAFETAWNPERLSPWCVVFNELELLALEYYEDLDHYWSDGFGYEITYKQACPPVKDFVDSFQSRIDNPSSSPNVIAYFTHSGTQLKLLARLGFF
jgi:multiple inositol-polyphosphate phosphatase/2,3-bisphosphoglycerate 3-phosphatase